MYLSENADHRKPRRLDHTGPVPHPHLRCLPSWRPLRPPASRGGLCHLEPSPGNRPGTAGGLGHLLPQRSFRQGALGDAQAHPRSRGKRVLGSSGDPQPSGIEGAKGQSKCRGEDGGRVHLEGGKEREVGSPPAPPAAASAPLNPTQSARGKGDRTLGSLPREISRSVHRRRGFDVPRGDLERSGALGSSSVPGAGGPEHWGLRVPLVLRKGSFLSA